MSYDNDQWIDWGRRFRSEEDRDLTAAVAARLEHEAFAGKTTFRKAIIAALEAREVTD